MTAGTSILITGASGGLGKETALQCARQGARLHLVCRNGQRAQATVDEIADRTGNRDVRVWLGDLSSRADVERIGDEFLASGEPLDVLVNNAGAVFGLRRELSVDGIEMTFALNHLAYFQLTRALLPRVTRVVNVTGDAYKDAKGRFDFDNWNADHKYRPIKQYAYSKLANILFTRELARQAPHVTAVAAGPKRTTGTNFAHTVHPLAKVAMTVARPFLLSVADGAAPIVHCATADGITSGSYWVGMQQAELQAAATNDDDARRLWALSEELLG